METRFHIDVKLDEDVSMSDAEWGALLMRLNMMLDGMPVSAYLEEYDDSSEA